MSDQSKKKNSPLRQKALKLFMVLGNKIMFKCGGVKLLTFDGGKN